MENLFGLILKPLKTSKDCQDQTCREPFAPNLFQAIFVTQKQDDETEGEEKNAWKMAIVFREGKILTDEAVQS